MKFENIKYSAFATTDGRNFEARFFVTEKAKNNWCNKQYRKQGEGVTVKVYDFKTDKLVETWHA